MQKNIQITIASDLASSVNNHRGPNGLPVIVASTNQHSIGIKELITVIGVLQTRRKNKSRVNAFNDKSDLLDYIVSDDDLKIELSSIRRHSPEVLKSISEDFGVGLGILALNKTIGIDWSTFSRISKSKLRSDFKCMTKNGERLVIECKGKAERPFSKKVIQHAIKQKRTESSDFCAVTLSSLFENQIVQTHLIDPDNDNTPLPNSKIIYKADHYAFVFNWLGDAEIARYFELIGERAKTGEISEEKQDLYSKIKKSYYELTFDNNTYLGKVLMRVDRSLQFIGFDKRLLNYNSFSEFSPIVNRENYQMDSVFDLFNDGIIIVDNFSPSRHLDSNQYFRVFPTSLEEMDEMSPNQFLHSIMHIINKYTEFGVYSSDFEDGLIRIFIDNGRQPHKAFVVVHSRMNLYAIDVRRVDAPIISNLDLTLLRPILTERIIDREIFRYKLHNENEIFNAIMG
jgi:hypothetical protein